MTIMPSSRERKNRRHLLPRNHQDHVGFHGASFSGAIFNLSTTIVGAGIMALPATLKVLGVLPGLAMIVAAAVLMESSIDIILKFASPKAAATGSYSGVVGEVFGGAGRAISQACITINNLGMLVVYMIIIGK